MHSLVSHADMIGTLALYCNHSNLVAQIWHSQFLANRILKRIKTDRYNVACGLYVGASDGGGGAGRIGGRGGGLC